MKGFLLAMSFMLGVTMNRGQASRSARTNAPEKRCRCEIARSPLANGAEVKIWLIASLKAFEAGKTIVIRLHTSATTREARGQVKKLIELPKNVDLTRIGAAGYIDNLFRFLIDVAIRQKLRSENGNASYRLATPRPVFRV